MTGRTTAHIMHLGGVVRFNRWEKSVGCPCLGSSFSCLDGIVIQGPATLALKPIEIEGRVEWSGERGGVYVMNDGRGVVFVRDGGGRRLKI